MLLVAGDSEDEDEGDWLLVRHALYLISVQASVSLDDAHRLMRRTAEATDTTLAELAEEVVSGRVRFDPS